MEVSLIEEPQVDKSNFVEYINSISRHPDVVSAHNEWEKVDQEWKDAIKESRSKGEIAGLAAKVRQARYAKDVIFDRVAILAEKACDSIDAIEEYNLDTLGNATVLEDVEELSIQWHETRRSGIGGSSVSECLGFHWMSIPGSVVYMTEEEVEEHWIDMAIQKCTEVIEVDNPTHGVLFRGHKWEPALIARYALSRNVRVAVSKATWMGKHKIQVINIDGIILDDEGNPEGILECKTSSREWTWQWGVPLHYRCQVLYYLNATGLDYADVLVKFDSGVFDVHRIYADETVDGTRDTLPIEGYMDMLLDRWEEIEGFKNTVENDNLEGTIWEASDKLSQEFDELLDNTMTDSVDDVIGMAEGEAPVVHIEFLDPYERMDEKFTTVSQVSVFDGGELLTHNIKTSPVLYPVPDRRGVDSSTHPLSLIPDSETIIAVDTKTYEYLCKHLGYEGIINASALRRLVRKQPGMKDYRSISEFVADFRD